MNIFWCIILLYGLLSLLFILDGLYDRHFTTKIGLKLLDFFKQEYDIQVFLSKRLFLPLKVKSFENNVVTLVFTGRSGSASLQYINKKYFDFLQISISVVLKKTSNYKLYCREMMKKRKFHLFLQ